METDDSFRITPLVLSSVEASTFTKQQITNGLLLLGIYTTFYQ